VGWGTGHPRQGELWRVWNFLTEEEQVGLVLEFPVLLKNRYITALVLTPTGVAHFAEGFMRTRVNIQEDELIAAHEQESEQEK
jgi:hypothetical protein